VGCVPRRRLTDQRERHAGRLELTACAVQLDRVSLAVDSAVVAQPYEYDRPLLPEIAEPDGVCVVVGQHQLGQHIGALRRRGLLATGGGAEHRG
jgi:hypothetical protein